MPIISYEWEVQGYYCGDWFPEYTAETRKEARDRLREYQKNCPSTIFRIRKVRVFENEEVSTK